MHHISAPVHSRAMFALSPLVPLDFLMFSRFLRSLASRLSPQLQHEVRRRKLLHQFARGGIISDEPEYKQLAQWIHPGDCVIDVGANIGSYTIAMSRFVGPSGRVFAFEPIPETFEILASIARRSSNVTLINAAVTSKSGEVRFRTPMWESGLANYYESSIDEAGPQVVFALALDSLNLPAISLVKIDAEGAEPLVLQGMERLLARDHPILIVEGGLSVSAYLAKFNYAEPIVAPGSPNAVFMARVPA